MFHFKDNKIYTKGPYNLNNEKSPYFYTYASFIAYKNNLSIKHQEINNLHQAIYSYILGNKHLEPT